MSLSTHQDLASILASVEDACAETQAVLIRGRFSGMDVSPVIKLEHVEMLSAIKAERPAAVFYSRNRFSADSFILSSLVANGWKEGLDERPGSRFPGPEQVREHFKGQIDALELRDDPHFEIEICYSRDGCVRTMEFAEQWAEDFYGEVADFIEAYIADAEIDNDEAELRAKAAMQSLIEEVAMDVGFRAIRGLPKRLIYLQKHYGTRIPAHSRGRLDRPAQHIELVDLHVSIVLKEASKLIASEEM
jgi:hypothetical protein